MKSNSEGLIIDGIAAFIDRDNIDTDQIIPTAVSYTHLTLPTKA